MQGPRVETSSGFRGRLWAPLWGTSKAEIFELACCLSSPLLILALSGALIALGTTIEFIEGSSEYSVASEGQHVRFPGGHYLKHFGVPLAFAYQLVRQKADYCREHHGDRRHCPTGRHELGQMRPLLNPCPKAFGRTPSPLITNVTLRYS